MMKPEVSFLDRFRKERKKLFDPDYAQKARALETPVVQPEPSSVSLVENSQSALRINDPYLNLARAEENYVSDLAAYGRELIDAGRGIDNALDQAAINLAQEHKTLQPEIATPAPQALEPAPMPLEPFHNPFSTIPGR